ncbi:hypothetical protein [Variovorax saccharolyticus]|uniref:hypothetical protein n=1 Tax=Variovorax saccharolyticus TaxID=3053516 RepID=UPI002578B4F4|nr:MULTISPECIES: hypothetical protein [unclassified Variovorax]MDM0018439.1 hypothetical protein [Variovorax sp. J22R187]MDM0024393.1 hypothetical protein [Variovorax sp. J31P216]
MATQPKIRRPVGTAFLALALAMAGSMARAQEIPLVTGEHWTKSTEQLKRVYLVGIANAYQVEAAYQGEAPTFESQTVVPRFAKGLKGQTLDSVRGTLDGWYAAHPDQLKRPVIETIWYQIVLPGLQNAK